MPEKNEPKTHVYLKSCGCLACAIINLPRNFKELGRAQRYAEKHGETYKLMETEDVRKMEWECLEHRKPKTSLQGKLEVSSE